MGSCFRSTGFVVYKQHHNNYRDAIRHRTVVPNKMASALPRYPSAQCAQTPTCVLHKERKPAGPACTRNCKRKREMPDRNKINDAAAKTNHAPNSPLVCCLCENHPSCSITPILILRNQGDQLSTLGWAISECAQFPTCVLQKESEQGTQGAAGAVRTRAETSDCTKVNDAAAKTNHAPKPPFVCCTRSASQDVHAQQFTSAAEKCQIVAVAR